MKFRDLDKTKTGRYSKTTLSKNLKKLRNEIVLNSLYYSDYENSFELDSHICCEFFKGYLGFLEEMELEEYSEKEGCAEPIDDFLEFLDKYDTLDNLIEWYYCHEEFGDE